MGTLYIFIVLYWQEFCLCSERQPKCISQVLETLLEHFSVHPFVVFMDSSLSSAAVVDPSLLRVNVIISRSVDYDGSVTGSVKAFIRDEADKPVVNTSVQINVNGQPLTLHNGLSAYDSPCPQYRLTHSTLSIEADAPYVVTVVLADGQEYTLGTIQTLPAITPAQFLPPTQHSRHQPLTLIWQDLEPHNWFVSQWKRWQGETSATTLKIAKLPWVNDLWNDLQTEQVSTDMVDYLAQPVGAGEDFYTIPVSYLAGPSTRYKGLALQLDSEKNLIVQKPFREGSVISSVNTTIYRIEITA